MKYGKKAGKALRGLRKHVGWSQEKLARYAGVSKSYWSKIENGVAPSTETVQNAVNRATERLEMIIDKKGKPVVQSSEKIGFWTYMWLYKPVELIVSTLSLIALLCIIALIIF